MTKMPTMRTKPISEMLMLFVYPASADQSPALR